MILTKDIRAKLQEALRMYLAEYGVDGYDQQTFVDFVIAQLGLATPRNGSGVLGLMDFYQLRIVELEHELEHVSGPCGAAHGLGKG